MHKASRYGGYGAGIVMYFLWLRGRAATVSCQSRSVWCDHSANLQDFLKRMPIWVLINLAKSLR